MNLLVLLSVLLFSHGGMGPRCADVFAKGVSVQQMLRVSAQEVAYESSELSRHGTVLSVSNPKVLADYKSTLLSRDGLYVFLLERSGTIVVDHHLPLPIDYSKASFHGTHRGLLHTREQDFSHLGKVEVVFAGELMVVGGTVVWVSDNSVFYYDAPKVPQRSKETDRDFRLRTKRENENLRQLAKNRLRSVQNLLLSWGWIDGNAQMKQIEESTGDSASSSRRWGHMNSRKLALFERNCRALPQCWNAFLTLESQIQRLTEANGLELSREKVQQLLKLDAQKAAILIQWLAPIRESGVAGIMNQQVNLQTGEPTQALQDFMLALDWYEART
jgi:hypothetical protein